MQSAYRPTLALVFFGNETRPSAVGLGCQILVPGDDLHAGLFPRIQLPTDVPSHRVHSSAASGRSILGPVSHSKRILAIIPLSSCLIVSSDPIADGRPITPRAFKCGFRSIHLRPGESFKKNLGHHPFVLMLQEVTVEYRDAANDRVREIHDEIE